MDEKKDIFLNRLLALPLFQGMSANDMQTVVAHTRIGFLRYEPGLTMIREGMACEEMRFLINGTAMVRQWSDDRSYAVLEQMSNPAVMQPERLFGMSQHYTCEITSHTDTRVITIGKDDIMRLSKDFDIFRINLLNLLTTRLQRLSRMPWRHQEEEPRARLRRFMESHVTHPAGEIGLEVKIEVLGRLLGESRRNTSALLHHLQDEGLVRMSRGRIVFPAFEDFVK